MSYYYRYNRYRRYSRRTTSLSLKPQVIHDGYWEELPPAPIPQDFGLKMELIPYLEDSTKREELNMHRDKIHKISWLWYIIVFIFLTSIFAFLYFHFNQLDYIWYIWWFTCIPFPIPLCGLWMHLVDTLVEKYYGKVITIFHEDEKNYEEYLAAVAEYGIKKEIFEKHQEEINISKQLGYTFKYQNLIETLSNILMPKNSSYWMSMSPRQFEIEIAHFFEKYYRYKTTVTKQTGDGGVDVIAKDNNQTIYIQCKHYSEPNHLGVKELNEFWGVCNQYQEKIKGIVVCTSSLTDAAKRFVRTIKESHGADRFVVFGLNDLIYTERKTLPSTNTSRNFIQLFKDFLKQEKFTDCHHLWLKECVYYTKEEARSYISHATKWKNMEYCILPYAYSSTNPIKIYFILLVNSYAMSKLKEMYPIIVI